MNNFNVLFYAAPSPMWVFDVNTLFILEVNEAAIRFYGFSKKEFLSKTIIDLRPPEDIVLVETVLSQIKSSQTNFREFRHKDKKGNIFHVEIMSHLIVFNNVDARLVIAQNIDEKKAMVGQLEVTRTKLNKILESTSIGFFQTDQNANITYWNTAAEKKIGYTRDFVLGKNIWDVLTEAVDTDFYEKFQEVMQKRVNVELNLYYWPVQKWFAMNAYPVSDGVIIHFRDITDNKIYEERLLEKIEQLQEVSYYNSHIIRKPVATLLGLTNLINNSIVTEDEYKDIASHIQECSVELDNVVQQINIKVNDDFTGCLFEELSNFSLTTLVNELIEKFKQKKPLFTITLKSDSNIKFYGNKQSIKIALNCLIGNAVKFSKSPKEAIETCLELVDNSIVFSVKDKGIGIDNKTLNNIFISFSKKSAGRQLGSGLLKVSEVAHRHNGNVWVESKPGEGSVFSMRLPMSNMVSPHKPGSAEDAATHGISINYDDELKCIVANWYGFQSLHSVKSGCLRLKKAVIEYNCSVIFNDNTSVIGTWDEAVEWVAKEYLPMLHDANVTHVAWVYSKSTFSRLSTDLALKTMTANIVIQTFLNKEKAVKWLMELNKQDL